MSSASSRARGVLLGQLVGDALGARYEFKSSAEVKQMVAADRRPTEPFLPILGGGPFSLAAGQITDDSEMALSLATSLLADGRYNQDTVATAYARWAQSSPPDIGIATSAALHAGVSIPKDWNCSFGVSDRQGVLRRVLDNVSVHNANSLSNGFLMRISPLAVFYRDSPPEQWLSFAWADASLTHCAAPVADAVRAYCTAIHGLINGMDRKEAYNAALKSVSDPIVRRHLELSEKQATPVPYGEGLWTDGDRSAIGYMGVALQVSFHHLLHSTSFPSALAEVVCVGGDTDTNCCIAAALLGALYGEEGIPSPWKDSVQSAPLRIRGENGLSSVAALIDAIVPQ